MQSMEIQKNTTFEIQIIHYVKKRLLPSLNITFNRQVISSITNLIASLFFTDCIASVKME